MTMRKTFFSVTKHFNLLLFSLLINVKHSASADIFRGTSIEPKIVIGFIVGQFLNTPGKRFIFYVSEV